MFLSIANILHKSKSIAGQLIAEIGKQYDTNMTSYLSISLVLMNEY